MYLWSSSLAVNRQSMSNSPPFRSCRRRMTTPPPSPSHPPWKPCHSPQKIIHRPPPKATNNDRRNWLYSATHDYERNFLFKKKYSPSTEPIRTMEFTSGLPCHITMMYICIVSRYRKANIYQIFSEVNHFLSIYLTRWITSEQKNHFIFGNRVSPYGPKLK